MPVSLKAHFDGQSIQLDEPFQLPANAQLLVTILSPVENSDEERASWNEFSQQGLARAYGADEPEYTVADIVP